jgi:hypothetical protein
VNLLQLRRFLLHRRKLFRQTLPWFFMHSQRCVQWNKLSYRTPVLTVLYIFSFCSKKNTHCYQNLMLTRRSASFRIPWRQHFRVYLVLIAKIFLHRELWSTILYISCKASWKEISNVIATKFDILKWLSQKCMG